ncbi:hypothetical protein [Pseudorhodobacter sp.]|uniref:hypothetical protein n=1 Tax=Pseudorhodobacter sp. TaxID=1934400 RepID=UPI002647415A|nr:hypothetical protein [Pseudorhodobacter sp.]MDN5788205.1 hypothetical protein [Pseudorhodobacter sp.]
MTTPEMLCVMPREMRMMSERILSLTALPKGFALMVGDVVMMSQALGLGGFALLETRLPELLIADPSRLAFDGMTLDGGGQHAWFIVPSLLDLLGLAVAKGAVARIKVTQVTDPAELRIAVALGLRSGLAVTIKGQTLRATATARADPLLDRVMQDGCAIPAALWWRIYALAQSALTPDSTASRRHAGPVIVTEDGKVIGRTDNDDDTDVNFVGTVKDQKQKAST